MLPTFCCATSEEDENSFIEDPSCNKHPEIIGIYEYTFKFITDIPILSNLINLSLSLLLKVTTVIRFLSALFKIIEKIIKKCLLKSCAQIICCGVISLSLLLVNIWTVVLQ